MIVAWTAFILWPVVCVILYRKMKLATALCTSIIGGYLLLPEVVSYDLPLLPVLNKHTIPTIAALVLTAIVLGDRSRAYPTLPGWIPRNRMALLFITMLIAGSFGTILTNRDTLFYGPAVLPGLRLYDAFSMVLDMLIILAPLLLGRRVLASREGQKALLTVLVISALLYTIPSLYEVRMSPQLHSTVYGIFPFHFGQAMRGGGFRPSVFLSHGLDLAIFITFAVIAAIGLFRTAVSPSRERLMMAAGWLFLVLVLCKSLGAFLIATVLAPVALLCKVRTQLMVAAVISGIVLVYPTLRAADLVPVQEFVTFIGQRSPERAQSLTTRIQNEDILLEKARERPLFGWGGWGRSRVYLDTGKDISITDGAWVIEFGLGGWIRYLAVFGLLCWPGIALFLSSRKNIDPTCAALALILTAKLIDLIPNAAMVPLIWLIAGSLLGRLEMQSATGEQVQDGLQTFGGRLRSKGQESDPETPVPEAGYARKAPRKKKGAAAAGDTAPKPARERTPYTRGKPAPRYRR